MVMFLQVQTPANICGAVLPSNGSRSELRLCRLGYRAEDRGHRSCLASDLPENPFVNKSSYLTCYPKNLVSRSCKQHGSCCSFLLFHPHVVRIRSTLVSAKLNELVISTMNTMVYIYRNPEIQFLGQIHGHTQLLLRLFKDKLSDNLWLR